MKRSPLILSTFFSALFVLFLAGNAPAAQISFISVSGNWHDPTDNVAGTQTGDPAITNGVPTSSVDWGVGSPQSGYDFTRNIPGSQTLPPAPTPFFPLGTFTHRNFPINDPSLTSVKLDVVLLLNVNGVTTGPLTFTFTFNHVETPNTQSPCPYPTPAGEGCTDRVTFTSSPQPTTFNVGGVDYTLSMSFVDDNGNPVAQFYTREKLVNTANLVGQFTLPPPPPSCGDQICNGSDTCSNCPQDCGICPPPPPSCGDGICNGAETCSSCAQDCGACPPPPPPPPPPTSRIDFNPSSYSVMEGAGLASITVIRSLDTSGTSTVQFASADGTAIAGKDYVAVSGTITFNPGETSKTFDVPIINDGTVDGNETVNLTLSNPTGATLGTSHAILTIMDQNPPPPPPPSPFISELVPYSAPEGFSSSFKMQVLGSGFASDAQVHWNFGGTDTILAAPVIVSASEIDVTVLPAQVSQAGQATVTVVNASMAKTSNPATFTIRALGTGNAPPWVVKQPLANPNPVNGLKTTQLSVLGGTFSNNGDESVLTYTWNTTGPAPVNIVTNGTNAAKNATASFSAIGSYKFWVRITDSITHFSVDTDMLTVVVNPAVSSVAISPHTKILSPGQIFTFTADVRDQFGKAYNVPVDWSASAGSVVGGVYTAPDSGQNILVTASAQGHPDSAQVTVGSGSGGSISVDISHAKAFPVPFKSNSGDGYIHFTGLAAGARIRIFTMNGRLVQTLESTGDTYPWNVKNANLDRVSSGVYLYVIEAGGQKKEGKLVIIQ